MKTALLFAALWLTTGVYGQQSKQPAHGLLLGYFGQPAGGIHGVLIGRDGQPAKGIRLYAQWECEGPLACPISRNGTVTDATGEFLFEPIGLGKYAVYVDDEEAGYSEHSAIFSGRTSEVEITLEQPDAELRLELPPKAGFLEIHLTDRTTGALIPSVHVKVVLAENPKWGFDMTTFPPRLHPTGPNCTIQIPPEKPLLLHVSSEGFQEWDESVGMGKPLILHSGTRLTWEVQLDPLPH